MADLIDGLLAWMLGLPAALVYVVVAAFAFLENVIPPIPADVVALFGGFLAGQGAAHPVGVFLCVWIGNVGGAMLIYQLGRRHGTSFLQGRIGRKLLRPGQLARLNAMYQKHGVKVILVSRFLPMFRAVVPVFAGAAGLSPLRTAVPLAIASGAWYGIVVYLGATAGQNWETIRAGMEASGRWLSLAAVVLFAAVALWWWRGRGDEDEAEA
jgi:membrane protein DedA with SNARE-associated domain